MMDVLTDLLKSIRLTASTYFCSDFTSPWGMEEVRSDFGMFHVIVAGRCWLKFPDSTHDLELSAGDIVVFPHGHQHLIGDRSGRRQLKGSRVVQAVAAGENPFAGEAIAVTLLCGYFNYDSSVNHPFMQQLPRLIHLSTDVQAQQDDQDNLTQLVNIIAGETRNPIMGTQAVVDRLTETFLIQVLRAFVHLQECEVGYLHALSSERLSRALAAIHDRPQHEWTLEQLADEAAMSRTGFANHFHEVVGMTPRAYLIAWRMQKARELLTTTTDRLTWIAEKSGYGSEAAFSKAFKKFYGQSPGRYRRTLLSEP